MSAQCPACGLHPRVAVQLVMGFFTHEVEFAWFAHLGGFACTPVVLAMRRREVARAVAVPAYARA